MRGTSGVHRRRLTQEPTVQVRAYTCLNTATADTTNTLHAQHTAMYACKTLTEQTSRQSLSLTGGSKTFPPKGPTETRGIRWCYRLVFPPVNAAYKHHLGYRMLSLAVIQSSTHNL
eukprot:m.1053598 g.1053598  ORF g.1053598 m.1053598 type:complete len:116 (-) comp24187_c1_seq20:70-417(-)